MILRGLRGFGDIDLSDDAVTMGDDLDLVDDTPMDDLSDSLAKQNTADVTSFDRATALPTSSASSSGFDWSSLASGAGSLLKSIFGGSSSKTGSSAQLTAANAAAAQAAQTRNLLLFGGVAVAIGGAILLARRRK